MKNTHRVNDIFTVCTDLVCQPSISTSLFLYTDNDTKGSLKLTFSSHNNNNNNNSTKVDRKQMFYTKEDGDYEPV